MNVLKLTEILNEISKTSLTNSDEVDRAGLLLEKSVLNVIDQMLDTEREQVLTDVIKGNHLQQLQALYEIYETNLENRFVENLLSHSIDPSLRSYLMYDRFVRLIKNEIDLAKIDNSQKIAFIGSGPLPITALLLNQLTGCKVDCYEHYLPAAQISRTLIEKFGVQDDISVIHEPGQQINAKQYSTVVVALLAKPKKSILAQLATTKSEDTSIVCRISDSLRQVFYETTLDSDIEDFEVIDKREARGDETISSVLLESR